MAGEVVLINPRRRRRSKSKRARAHSRRSRRTRRNPIMVNRRRRAHRRAHARRHRRVHRNPRLPFLGNVNLNAIGAGTFGYIGTRYASTWALSFLPAAWSAQNPALVRIGVKAVVGMVALPMIARMFRMKGIAGPMAIGAGIAVAADIFETYAAKMLPLPAGVTSISDYETGYITDYETGVITGFEEDAAGAYGGGAY